MDWRSAWLPLLHWYILEHCDACDRSAETYQSRHCSAAIAEICKVRIDVYEVDHNENVMFTTYKPYTQEALVESESKEKGIIFHEIYERSGGEGHFWGTEPLD